MFLQVKLFEGSSVTSCFQKYVFIYQKEKFFSPLMTNFTNVFHFKMTCFLDTRAQVSQWYTNLNLLKDGSLKYTLNV